MSQDKSPTAGRKLRRNWTPARIAAVRAYRQQHTSSETQEHFRISGTMLSKWANGHKAPRGGRLTSAGTQSREVHIFAKRLRKEVMKRVAGGQMDDLEMYAMLLTKEILK